jgi:hypothetical protein
LGRSTSSLYGISEIFINVFPIEKKRLAIDDLIESALANNYELAEQLFFKFIGKELRQEWLMSHWEKALQNPCDNTLNNYSKLLLNAVDRDGLTEDYSRLAIILASIDNQSRTTLKQIITKKIYESLEDTDTNDNAEFTIFDLIKENCVAKIAKELKQFEQTKKDLEIKIQETTQELKSCKRELDQKQELIKNLQTGFKLPEQWAEFRGKKQVLDTIIDLYQHIIISKKDFSSSELVEWTASQIKNLILLNGISFVEEVNKSTAFNPLMHQSESESLSSGENVIVTIPGFKWRDPAGREIILVKAKVSKNKQ